MVKRSERSLQLRGPVPAIVMGARSADAQSRTEWALDLLLRGIAVVWMLEGLQQWIAVLTGPAVAYLPAIPPLTLAALFFFCILNFVAAVGLWLVANWGVAVWCATILGHGLALVLAPGFLADPVLLLAADAVLGAAYGSLSWIMVRERRAL